MLTSDLILFTLPPVLFLLLSFVYNLRRSQKILPVSLQPNCLITRHPIIFIGNPSPFYFFTFWNQTPHYLKEHGYSVHQWNLSGKNSMQRQENLLRRLQQIEKVHLVFEEREWLEWKDFLSQKQEGIASATFVTTGSSTPKNSDKEEHVFFLETKSSKTRLSFIKVISSIFLMAHNLWRRGAIKSNGQVLGIPGVNTLSLQTDFLGHVVNLAERDFFLGHQTELKESSATPDVRWPECHP